MNAFVLTMFWLFVANVVISVVHLADEHPRKRVPASFGLDATGLIIELAALAWMAHLLWGRT